MRVTVAEIAAAGGFERWHADMTRRANLQSLKSATRGRGKGQDDQSTTRHPKTPAAGSSARNRHTPGVPNQTEQRYRDEFLIPRILSGEIAECVFEGATIILKPGRRATDRCTYTPDFWVRTADGRYEANEVKGAHVFEDSRIKLKWAVTVMPAVRFVWAQWRGGKWTVTEVRR